MQITWYVGETYRLFDASLTLDEIIDEMWADDSQPDWAILRRPDAGNRLYAYRLQELDAFREMVPDSGQRPAVYALNLHETDSSIDLPPGRPDTDVVAPPYARQPASLRVVRLDDALQPVAVGEMTDWDGEYLPP
ncbi:MAG: hypothetical protein M9890_12175, partial [Thermomicrobiales bacterium]|nr:hypothetical protein [Thermomicrobiales bacterium]